MRRMGAMPELPEVETAARDLDAQIAGVGVVGLAHLHWPRMIEGMPAEAFAAAIAGRTIQRVGRRAKWILAELDAGLVLAIHLRMSGVVWVAPADEPLAPHTHLALALADGRQLRFKDVRKFGRMRLLDARGLAALEAAHGVEPLSEAFTPLGLDQLLAKRTTRLKVALLDQTLIAGLGNIYVDEALWNARLHPERKAGSLDVPEVAALHAAIQFVLRRSLDLGGSSFRDYRNGYGQEGGNQATFAVYRQADAPCPRCGTPVSRTVIAGRGTHWCGACQRPPDGDKTTLRSGIRARRTGGA